MMVRKNILFFVLIPVLNFTGAWQKGREKVNWIKFEDLSARLATDPRPVLIDLYTDWCGWCKVMDRKTYSHPEVVAYLNKKFHVVKFNAESKDVVVWKGKTYRYNQRYRTHELAVALTNGELAYPTTVFIPSFNADPQAIPGYLEVRDMERLVTYYGDGKYKILSFDVYAKGYKTSWK